MCLTSGAGSDGELAGAACPNLHAERSLFPVHTPVHVDIGMVFLDHNNLRALAERPCYGVLRAKQIWLAISLGAFADVCKPRAFPQYERSTSKRDGQTDFAKAHRD